MTFEFFTKKEKLVPESPDQEILDSLRNSRELYNKTYHDLIEQMKNTTNPVEKEGLQKRIDDVRSLLEQTDSQIEETKKKKHN